jgi:hypothetical protein
MLKKNCIICNKEFDKPYTRSLNMWDKSKFCSYKCSGIFKRGKPSPTKGKKLSPHTEEWKLKMKEWHKNNPNSGQFTTENMSKEKHLGWKGGITPINQAIRGSLEYKIWQDSVFNLGFNCCKKCGERRVKYLVAHHILNFSSYPELRFALDNGITFCKPCHKEFHKKYGYKNNNYEQVKEFLK